MDCLDKNRGRGSDGMDFKQLISRCEKARVNLIKFNKKVATGEKRNQMVLDLEKPPVNGRRSCVHRTDLPIDFLMKEYEVAMAEAKSLCKMAEITNEERTDGLVWRMSVLFDMILFAGIRDNLKPVPVPPSWFAEHKENCKPKEGDNPRFYQEWE